MFLGTHTPKLDEKGRVILPAKFRDELSSGLVLTKGQEGCLYVFSQREFESYYAQLRQAPLTNQGSRDFLRVFLSGASQELLDSQNRVTIAQELRTYAGLERDLTVIGVGNHAEIWATSAWDAYYAAKESGFSATSEEVIPGLF
jgi:MraZ protein